MLATLVDEAPEGDEWLHEIKYDGYRLVCHVKDNKAKLYTRNQKNWTDRFAAVAEAAEKIDCDAAVLDGEIVAVDENGISHFQHLQQSLKGKGRRLYYYVFDLLYLDGYDLRKLPLVDRKEKLKDLLDGSDLPTTIRYSDHVTGNGAGFYDEACKKGLEGIISKNGKRPYREKRTKDWLKVKCVMEQEFVIVGFSDPSGSRVGFGALLLGVHEDGELIYSGRVGTGFTDDMLRDMSSKLERIERKTPPVEIPQSGVDVRDVHWVTPKMVAEVAFTEWTADGMLRHPSFKGLREDKPADDIVRERPK